MRATLETGWTGENRGNLTMMEFHISGDARRRYDVEEQMFGFNGNVVFANLAASRRLAARMNEKRGTAEDPEQVIHAAALFAMGLIDELSHALVDFYRRQTDPAVMQAALEWFRARVGEEEFERLLRGFATEFPNTAIFAGKETVNEWLEGRTGAISHREAAFEELLLLWLANTNPAFRPFGELFADDPLRRETEYAEVTAGLGAFFATRPPINPQKGQTLLDALRAPMLASPDSLSGQLAYIRENWTEQLGEELRRILLAIDVLKEEEVAIWMQFHPMSAEEAARRRALRGGRGQFGDGSFGTYYDGPPDFAASGLVNEYEAFSPDQDWMPTVVLIAKSTYVWLEQLSRKYGRHIHRLDQIPEDELALLKSRGLNGLWLIGIWERSHASQTIKHLRGQSDAVASAYSLADYRIADDLGGTAAYEVLRDRAAAQGIRLASDMVPNHMGIDSTWMIEHPEWFLSRPDSPYPSYRFDGPDLSTDPRVEIKLEDHYYDQTDAAVAFRYRDHRSGRTEYVYHGNDGTSFAWNDTAQLDYSQANVREQVIQTILSVARLFPIIRFDAAMVLAKKHVQRLWFPLPGTGGSIPSRAEFSMTQTEFDALMPAEFWREVVDRVAIEVPGTLLLAEAFWLLEGYFVRTLGMHRVYNSAFMNMMRDEENAKYRSVIKNTIEFDPDILKRYVNFMSNPDERTAIDQFGTGDKYFGVCTMMATLPGLPMFGHGQVEAFTEKYGMEYKRARYEEWPNEELVARHQREIAPLLKKRWLFAESSNFVMYDLWRGDGSVDENVFAYSNRSGDQRALVLFNNAYASTSGTIQTSVASMEKATGVLRQRSLSDALGLSGSETILAYRDSATGMEHLRRSSAVREQGLSFHLRGYQYAVLGDWRELTASAAMPWDQLCDVLNGSGVPDLHQAISRLRLQPVYEVLRHLLDPALMEAAIEQSQHMEAKRTGRSKAAKMSNHPGFQPLTAEFAQRARAFYAAVAIADDGRDDQPVTSDQFTQGCVQALTGLVLLPSLEARFGQSWPVPARMVLPSRNPSSTVLPIWATALSYGVLASFGRAGLTVFDGLQLRSFLAELLQTFGLGGEGGWRAAARVRLLLEAESNGAGKVSLSGPPPQLWQDAEFRWLAGVNESEGVSWFNQESLQELIWWWQLPELLHLLRAGSVADAELRRVGDHLRAKAEAAGRAGFRVDRYLAEERASSPAPTPPAPKPNAAGKGTDGGKPASGKRAPAAGAKSVREAGSEKLASRSASEVNNNASKATAAEQRSAGESQPAVVGKPGSSTRERPGKAAKPADGVSTAQAAGAEKTAAKASKQTAKAAPSPDTRTAVGKTQPAKTSAKKTAKKSR